MPKPPEIDIDPRQFWEDPYPMYEKMQETAPVCFVPQLGAILFTKRDDIFECEKNIEVFSSYQPEGLMTKLMGENLMRKDGDDHLSEKRQIFPSVSPKSVRDIWTKHFREAAVRKLTDIKGRNECDLVKDYALPVSAEALKTITGLTQLTAEELDWSSQSMIDGCANYVGDKKIEASAIDACRFLDNAINEKLEESDDPSDMSMVGVLKRAGQNTNSIHANIKLAISGGQNEPRDAIAGCVWALLNHPDQLELIKNGQSTWLQAFEEYARWISPIGMSPRRVAKKFEWTGVSLEPEERVFFMFGAANRDRQVFENPGQFDIARDTSKSISFGAGPHFCAGAAASRSLIAEVALPMLFEELPGIRLAGETPFGGWAFRGPLEMPVVWN